MDLLSRRQLAVLVTGQNEFAKKILEQRINGLETVNVTRVIAEQDVLLKIERVVPSAFDEEQGVLEQVVGFARFFAEKGAPRLPQDALLQITQNLVDVLANLAEDVAAIGLELGQACLQDVCLLAAFEMLAAAPDPLLALE